jgi:hypothetical protein
MILNMFISLLALSFQKNLEKGFMSRHSITFLILLQHIVINAIFPAKISIPLQIVSIIVIVVEEKLYDNLHQRKGNHIPIKMALGWFVL